MAAVIWTDAIQLVVYLVGAVVAAFVLLGKIPGGWNEVVAVGNEFHKFNLFDFTFDLSRSYTFWSGVIGGAFLTTATHGTDQLMVQRYLCARNSRQATLALLTSGAVIFAQFILFLLIGVMLFVFYQKVAVLPPEVAAKADRVFPHFIVTQLPTGLIGLVVAAIFAAAMSTLSSSLNSLSATAVTDFYRPLFARDKSDAHYLNVSRLLTAPLGCCSNRRGHDRHRHARSRCGRGAGRGVVHERADPWAVSPQHIDAPCRAKGRASWRRDGNRLHDFRVASAERFLAMVCVDRVADHLRDADRWPVWCSNANRKCKYQTSLTLTPPVQQERGQRTDTPLLPCSHFANTALWLTTKTEAGDRQKSIRSASCFRQTSRVESA